MGKEELDKIAKLGNWDKIIAALEAAGYERVTVENKYNCPLSDFKGCKYAASEYYRKFFAVFGAAIYRNVPGKEQYEYILAERLKLNTKGVALPEKAVFYAKEL